MKITLPLKPFHAPTLRDEIAAAGVEIGTISALGVSPFRVNGSTLEITVGEQADEATVSQVYNSHNAPAEKRPEQIKRERLTQSLAATDDQSERLKVVIRVLYQSLVETRAWCNQVADSLQAAGMPTPPRLRNRTWEEAVQSVMLEIQKEVQP